VMGTQSQVEIYNMQGQLVKQISNLKPVVSAAEPSQISNEIDVSTLSKGIYLIRLQTSNTILTKKLIIQ
jgi:hypothetical protein